MNRVLIFFLCLVMYSCSKNEMQKEGTLILEAVNSDVKFELEVVLQRRNNILSFEIISGVNAISLNIERSEVGEYWFGKGSRNNAVWLTKYYSDWEVENSGFLRIEESEGGKISGELEILFMRDRTKEEELVRGTFRKVEVNNTAKGGVTTGIGKINGEWKGTSFSDVRDYGDIRSWQLFRPGGESITLYINKNTIGWDDYDLNKDSIPTKCINPHIEYILNNRLYSSRFGEGSFRVVEINEGIGLMECQVNAEMGNAQDSSIIKIEHFGMYLYSN